MKMFIVYFKGCNMFNTKVNNQITCNNMFNTKVNNKYQYNINMSVPMLKRYAIPL